MASVSIVIPVSFAAPKSSEVIFKPHLPLPALTHQSKSNRGSSLRVQASLSEKAVTGLTAAAFTASMAIPEVAQAADGSLTPSLNNFLLSIAAGGVVLTAIIGAVVGVSNFDPVNRS